MVKVLILPELVRQVQRKFKKSAKKIFDLMEELELFPIKGKELGHIGKILIKEIKYESFRFCFITNGHILKCVTDEGLANLLIKFVRMSDKDTQQKTTVQIKKILRKVGFENFR